ncbi:NH(3)-dependent NAD(+) synthetase [Striga asiatica]|uniref:NH(3)-dependent NAD(+) synthetase n=1 Tax=Striga asiatica TaxID=4170 RepID=A0A5A7QER4_STRAF|nr:NH(3)-dependent NAD(+) synthetase [Striga asiatica]
MEVSDSGGYSIRNRGNGVVVCNQQISLLHANFSADHLVSNRFLISRPASSIISSFFSSATRIDFSRLDGNEFRELPQTLIASQQKTGDQGASFSGKSPSPTSDLRPVSLTIRAPGLDDEILGEQQLSQKAEDHQISGEFKARPTRVSLKRCHERHREQSVPDESSKQDS